MEGKNREGASFGLVRRTHEEGAEGFAVWGGEVELFVVIEPKLWWSGNFCSCPRRNVAGVDDFTKKRVLEERCGDWGSGGVLLLEVVKGTTG